VLGVLGGGQLGRMLAEARPDVRFRFLDPSPEACAGARGELIVAAYDDPEALDRLADGVVAVTWEFENVPVRALEHLEARGVPVRPGPASLRLSGDRVREKQAFEAAGLAVAPWQAVDGPGDVAAAFDAVVDRGADEPAAMLKARSGGYDGKGQATVRSADPAEAEAAWARIGGVPAILERRVPFGRELSIAAVRGTDGTVRVLPPAQNEHVEGILHRTFAPADVDPPVLDRLRAAVRRFAAELDHVGILVIELFDAGGTLLANEVAARVHNSYHWTIGGADPSQFDLHVAAVLGERVAGSVPDEPATVASIAPVAMINLVGTVPDASRLALRPGSTLHLYGKSPRPGRKLGHVNVRGGGPAEVRAEADRIGGLALAARGDVRHED